MRLLILGDVVGQGGCQHLRNKLPDLRKQYGADVVIANGENSAEGNGILPHSANHMLDSGVNIITTGNHALRRREIYDVLDEEEWIIRPANLHPTAPGRGYTIYDGMRFQLCVINLMGVVYMDHLENPFDCIDRILSGINTKNIVVDFHGEATSEKLAMAFYLDGRVSAVVGTHTHVQTADERILPGGTGYITDLGMCGSFNSALGVRPDLVIRRLRTLLPTRFENDTGEHCLSGVVLDIDPQTGKTTHIERINIR